MTEKEIASGDKHIAALLGLTNGFKYSTPVVTIAREALGISVEEADKLALRSEPYRRGYADCLAGKQLMENPYPYGMDDFNSLEWVKGFGECAAIHTSGKGGHRQ